MESGAAEAVVDGARWQGEFRASVQIEKGKIEFRCHSLIPLNSLTPKIESIQQIPPLHRSFACH